MSRSNCRFLNTDTSRGRSAGWKKAQPADRPRDVCILICEELLDHLLKSGYRKIGVTVKGRKMRVIEIRAEGEDSSHHSYHLDKNDENDENVKRMMRSEEAAIRQMIKETDGDSYEDRRSLSQELSFDYTSSVFEKQHLDLDIPQMKTLGIMTADGIYTNLGLLLSDQCPHIIKAAVFSGTDQDVFQNRREFGGSLLKQVDDAYAFLDMQNEKSATFDGLHRTDHRAYPEAALREALLNAVIHRDYSYAASTLISAYADRMEIVSVGGLISGFSLADVMAGLSICRNPKLANVFYRLDLIEAYGTGLKKIMNAYSGITAETLFQVTENVFKATLPRKTSIGMKRQQSHATNEEKIRALFASSETITRADVEQTIGMSVASSSRLLRKMVEDGKLAVTGAGKNTRYYIP